MRPLPVASTNRRQSLLLAGGQTEGREDKNVGRVSISSSESRLKSSNEYRSYNSLTCLKTLKSSLPHLLSLTAMPMLASKLASLIFPGPTGPTTSLSNNALRLAPEETSIKLTGYEHNSVTCIGMQTDTPVILDEAIVKLDPDFLWLGGGDVDLSSESEPVNLSALLNLSLSAAAVPDYAR
ncbi:uncharacterized protein LOC111277216 [Durio zibethinus]|uniref:Uncharacterized protein LOC111277216 n=1 Tax=Durio zibethinus TaxID=66656 RepID=A0A6P5WUP2_DURZI|nr:uncharacterized protein LOC111277216 [Durio zibethinus]